jgi:outer membrane protein assembly factor BamB
MSHAATSRSVTALAALCTLAIAACGPSGNAVSGGHSRPPSAVDPAPVFIDLEQAWAWNAAGSASVGMPAADGSDVAVTADGRLVLLDGSGTRRWALSHQNLRGVAPALTPQLVLAATDDGVIAVGRGDGRLRWEARLGDGANTPAVSGSTAVVTTGSGSIAGIDLGDGRLAWRAKLDEASLGPPAGVGATVTATFAGPSRAGAVAVDAATGRQRWKVAVPPRRSAPRRW